jgi:hypothetical protein
VSGARRRNRDEISHAQTAPQSTPAITRRGAGRHGAAAEAGGGPQRAARDSGGGARRRSNTRLTSGVHAPNHPTSHDKWVPQEAPCVRAPAVSPRHVTAFGPGDSRAQTSVRWWCVQRVSSEKVVGGREGGEHKSVVTLSAHVGFAHNHTLLLCCCWCVWLRLRSWGFSGELGLGGFSPSGNQSSGDGLLPARLGVRLLESRGSAEVRALDEPAAPCSACSVRISCPGPWAIAWFVRGGVGAGNACSTRGGFRGCGGFWGAK